MQGIDFFLQYGDKKRKKLGIHTWNVLAVLTGKGKYYENGVISYNAIGAVGDITLHPNLPVDRACVAEKYLIDTCAKITEVKARGIHPNLFSYLDSYALPHNLTLLERTTWLKAHRPQRMTSKEFTVWCKHMITSERVTRGKPLYMGLCGTCHGVPYSDYDDTMGMKQVTPKDDYSMDDTGLYVDDIVSTK
jgi:hypothetical protein